MSPRRRLTSGPRARAATCLYNLGGTGVRTPVGSPFLRCMNNEHLYNACRLLLSTVNENFRISISLSTYHTILAATSPILKYVLITEFDGAFPIYDRP